ncbi:MAG: type II secretion system minor pseudopilin GspK, partial [Deltaproteobacteria bacterium]|nr:type II secretion system minor pseudopilin GspK [Deltaproteobacteria bacterium]
MRRVLRGRSRKAVLPLIVYDRSGMALVLTLLAVSFLVAVTVQLGTSVNWQMHSAANQGKIVQLDAMLLSGLNLARAALLADQQKNDYDSSFDDWGEFEQDTLAALFTEGTLEIKVTDLSGLLQVNGLVLTDEEKKRRQKEQIPGKKGKGKGAKKDPEKLQRDLWKRFLTSGNFVLDDEDAAAGLIDSLVDWLDTDDEEHDNGAERGYYSSRNPPYIPANGPILFLEELLLVKGWNKKNLYGEKEHSGIIDYLTIAGQDGMININTAPVQVLKSLHADMTEELAADLVDFRSEEENSDLLAQPGWYRQAGDFPGDITFEKELITTSSSSFLVTITARIDGLQHIGHGVVHRNENTEQT